MALFRCARVLGIVCFLWLVTRIDPRPWARDWARELLLDIAEEIEAIRDRTEEEEPL